MAKKNDAAYEAFLADLKVINPRVEELLADEKVSTKLREGVLARAEFSSGMDSLKAEREKFNSEVSEARQRIAGWQKWYGDTSAQVAGMQEKLNRYVEEYGELTDAEKRQAAKEAGLSKAEFERQLSEAFQQRDLANLKFADDLTDIKIDYKERFKDKLDTAAVYEIAGKQGLPLTAAYSIYIADKVEEQQKQKYEEDIKRARQEAVEEYASKHNLPVVSTTPDIVHVTEVKDAPTTSRDRVAAAMRGLAEIRSGR